jgi:hypothetical protein
MHTERHWQQTLEHSSPTVSAEVGDCRRDRFEVARMLPFDNLMLHQAFLRRSRLLGSISDLDEDLPEVHRE